MKQAAAQFAQWMQAVGMETHSDAAANLIGRYRCGLANARRLIVGSHIDTVPNAGRYDGVLGVLLGIALVEALKTTGTKLPFDVVVVAFSEEEGVRYATPFIGSTAMAGRFDRSLLDCKDIDGIAMCDALKDFGADPDAIATAEIDSRSVIGYIEPHIEQGPLLESSGVPLGVVSAIAGQSRAAITFRGRASHAGTTPMPLRHDALAAAAEWILAVEAIAKETEGLFATVGQIENSPNVANVISGEVRLCLDLRHADDCVRSAKFDQLSEFGREIARRRQVDFHAAITTTTAAVAMDARLTEELRLSLEETGTTVEPMTSGAGHDAAIIAGKVPSSMLFIRCREGISHHPAEAVECDDVAAALGALLQFAIRLAKREAPIAQSPEGSHA